MKSGSAVENYFNFIQSKGASLLIHKQAIRPKASTVECYRSSALHNHPGWCQTGVWRKG